MRIVCFDIESTDLSASWGRLLCASFYPITDLDIKPFTLREDADPYRTDDPLDQHKFVVDIRNTLETYNMIVTWNGKMFDIPLLNAFLLKYDERPCRVQFHLDLMYFARQGQARIGSSKLDNVQKFFQTPTAKTPLDGDTWKRAALGDKASMDAVVEHCKADVVTLSEQYWKLLPLVANIHR